MCSLRLVSLVCCALSASDAAAQRDFSGLNLKPGDFVYVTDATGIEVSGPVSSLSPSLLAIGPQFFTPSPGLTIERRGDPLWDGALYGVLGGLAVGAIFATGECGTESVRACVLGGVLWGAGLGTFIDFRHKGRTRVFIGSSTSQKPSAGSAPAVSGGSASLMVRVRF